MEQVRIPEMDPLSFSWTQFWSKICYLTHGAEMKVSDYMVQFFRERNIETVFGYSGGAITHLMDSLNQCPGIKFIQTYHEQTAAIAAEGYSWRSKGMGVAIATSGPGATNLITGIADAYFDSIPAFFVTGQVNTYEYKGDKPIRQQGFQEMDIVSVVKPITKYAAMVNDASRIRYELEKAWFIAADGRGGPVLLDVPMDIQRAQIDPSDIPSYSPLPTEGRGTLRCLNDFSLEKLTELIKRSERPILLLGGGVHLAKAEHQIREFARKMTIPVVVSLLGKGAFPEDDALFAGMIGSYGNRCANMAIANSDLVIALGTRLDTRQTGTNLPSFIRSGRIVRLDIDEAELQHHRLRNVDCILGNIPPFVQYLSTCQWNCNISDWVAYVRQLVEIYGQNIEINRNVTNKKPYDAIQILNDFAAPNQLFTADIGQNQMFAAQQLTIRENQSWRTSGGHAPMGFALPAAIGAAFAERNTRPIYAITGDGGLHMAMQSLLLISQYALNIKVILLNNRSLGMITQFQDLYFDRRKEGTTKESGYLVPDFGGIAAACGLAYHNFRDDGFLDGNLLESAFRSDGPALIEFEVGEHTVVSPKLEVNMPVEEPSPQLSKDELRRSMKIKPWNP